MEANEYIISAREPKEKTHLKRQGFRWHNDIKMDLNKVDCEDVHSTRMAQDGVYWEAVVNTVMNLGVP
jgi:hypothetical protein